MKVSYNGFIGELVKLERSPVANVIFSVGTGDTVNSWKYKLSIWDSDKKATISFDGVKLENVKFIGGAVTFE